MKDETRNTREIKIRRNFRVPCPVLSLAPYKGFTLIELIVSISIMGILSSFGAAKFSDFNKTETVRQAALDLENNLILIRNKAMAGEKVCGSSGCGGDVDTCFGSEPLSGWSVTFNPDTNCWGRNGKCDSGCGVSSVASQDVYTSCAKGGVCGGNCWSTNGLACDSQCRYANATLSTVYPNCSSSPCGGGGNCWTTGGGKCDSGCGAGSVSRVSVSSNCISFDCSRYRDYAAGYDKAGTFKGCRKSCFDWWRDFHFWNPLPGDAIGCRYNDPRCHICYANCGQRGYITSGLITKYLPSGGCGGGRCYKMTGGGTYYTSGPFGNCGVSGCSSGFYYDNYVSCWWLSARYSYSVGGPPIQAYQGGGNCSGSGTGSCHKLTNSGTYYTGSAPCGGGYCAGRNTYFKSSQPCSFLGAIYGYTASNKVTKLKGAGSCSNDGSGDCHKMLSSANYYTGDGGCGSSCPSNTFYDSSLKCEFYGEAGGANAVYQIRGVCGENVFNFKNFNLPKGVVISHSPEEIVFKPIPAFGVENSGDICVSGFGKNYKITITDTGTVKRVGFVETCL